MIPKIINAFKIYLTTQNFNLMYCELSDGQFTKSYLNNGNLEIDLINRQEYLYAMTYKNSISHF